MKIAQVCYMYPPAIGGVEKHVEKISKYLKRDGHDVEVFCSDYTSLNRKSRTKTGRETIDGIKVNRFRGRYIPGYGQKIAFPGLFLALMRADIDIIHVHSFPSVHFDICWAVSKLRNIPLVATGHFDPILLDEATRKLHKRVYWNLWLRKALKRCRIIAIIDAERRKYIQNFGISPHKVSVLPNGVDLDELREVSKRDIGTLVSKYKLKNKKIILFVGRICRAKGIDILIRAVKPILERDKSVRLVIAGPVDDHAYFDEIKRMAVPGVVITGPLDRKQVLAAYSACSVFVLPTRGEVFGITIVEAMMFKKIVIATRVGGVPDIIDSRTGYMFEQGDYHDLRNKIEYALKNYKRLGKMRENAYKKVISKFSWKEITKKLEKIYGEELR
jgi:glycosyltransferase involved in cell wall biosynthesis